MLQHASAHQRVPPNMNDFEDTTIGRYTLKAPKGTFYNKALPTLYDYGPWAYIASLVRGMNGLRLVDVGGNIGDSVAWWKTLVGGSATSIEPSPVFFSFLQANVGDFADVECVNALVIGESHKNRVTFQSGSSTGQTRIASEQRKAGEGSPDASPVYVGPTITTRELLNHTTERIVFKTDTDGFDDQIVLSLAQELRTTAARHKVPVIFMEGPSLLQVRDGEYDGFVQAFEELVAMEYHCAVFANAGSLLCGGLRDRGSVLSVLRGLEMSILNQRAYCHYLDFVFHDPSLSPLEGWADALNARLREQSLDKTARSEGIC